MTSKIAFRFLLVVVLTFLAARLPAAAQSSPPRVVASIAPLHGLAASIMAGVGKPQLLLDGRSSPHDAVLRPSQARAIAKADLVVWIGPELERFLKSFLRSPNPGRRILTVTAIPTLKRLALRQHGVWTEPPEHSDHSERGKRCDHETDPHVWLSIGNARIIASALTDVLSKLDPPHASDYARNLSRLDDSLRALDRDIRKMLAGVNSTPFVLLHDAFQYFEKAYDLQPAGALENKAAGGASAKQLRSLEVIIREQTIRCIAADPFGASAVAKSMLQTHAMKLAQLDPMGQSIPPGPGHYQAMMRANAEALASCLRLG